MSFTIFLEVKNGFQGYKKKKLKSRKIDIFPNPWFWSKNGLVFQLFVLRDIGQENVFYNIPERKNCILRYKNKSFKKLKNCHFSKGVNPWFWSKNAHFPTFFLGNIGQKNVFYDISRTKKRLSRL